MDFTQKCDFGANIPSHFCVESIYILTRLAQRNLKRVGITTNIQLLNGLLILPVLSTSGIYGQKVSADGGEISATIQYHSCRSWL